MEKENKRSRLMEVKVREEVEVENKLKKEVKTRLESVKRMKNEMKCERNESNEMTIIKIKYKKYKHVILYNI